MLSTCDSNLQRSRKGNLIAPAFTAGWVEGRRRSFFFSCWDVRGVFLSASTRGVCFHLHVFTADSFLHTLKQASQRSRLLLSERSNLTFLRLDFRLQPSVSADFNTHFLIISSQVTLRITQSNSGSTQSFVEGKQHLPFETTVDDKRPPLSSGRVDGSAPSTANLSKKDVSCHSSSLLVALRLA